MIIDERVNLGANLNQFFKDATDIFKSAKDIVGSAKDIVGTGKNIVTPPTQPPITLPSQPSYNAPTSFWSSPAGISIMVGGGVILVGGLFMVLLSGRR